MHISEAILAATTSGKIVLAAGAVAAAAGTAVGLNKLDYERIPRVAVLSSAFFVISLIQVPVFGVSSVHLMLTGLMGLLLGWAIFPAVLIALILQMITTFLVGPSTLGLNTMIMAAPGVVCYYVFRRAVHSGRQAIVFAAAFAAGATAIVLGALIGAGALLAAGKGFEVLGYAFAGTNLILAVAEGIVTGYAIVFLRKVRPELLNAPILVTAHAEVSRG